MKKYAEWILRYRAWVIAVILVVTVILGYFAAGLKIIIDSETLSPQDHPYVQASNRLEQLFGSKCMVLIGVTATHGDVFEPAVLDRVNRMTEKLNNLPGVVNSTLMSLTANQTKVMNSTAEGFEVHPLIEKFPVTSEDKDGIIAALRANPVYLNTIVSSDLRTAAIVVELKDEPDGFTKMMAPIKEIIDAERGPEVNISYSGTPVYLAMTERLSERIKILFPIALLVIGLLHFEAFRTKQGLILPLVSALMSVIWGLGIMGVLQRPLDIFNSPTPILILAVAAGHAVQLLKRYYEEYDALRSLNQLTPLAANDQAVILSLIGVGPVMLIAGGIAALGFFSLIVFKITTIQTFGIFTGCGIVSALLLEMTFIPAVRSLLKPPTDADRARIHANSIWDRVPAWIANQVISRNRRRWVIVGFSGFSVLGLLGMASVVVENDNRSLFSSKIDVQVDNKYLNERLGGTMPLYILVEGQEADAIKSPSVLKAIESTQRFAEGLPHVGKTISIVDHLKRMNQVMNGGLASEFRLPERSDLVSQYLLLYSFSGEPDDFRSFVNYDYKSARITILMKTSSSVETGPLVSSLKDYAEKAFGPGISVRIGGDITDGLALSETMVQGKILNMIQMVLAVFLISALAFRSLIAGIIVLIPLVIGVITVFGVMGFSSIPMNVSNSIIAAMAVGIGADYAIYLLYRMREIMRSGVDMDAAIRSTLATAGKATLFVATAVSGGYGVLAFSDGFYVHLWLALFIVISMVVTAMASLFLVPILVIYLRPKFIFDRTVSGKAATVFSILALCAGLFTVENDARAQEKSPLAVMQEGDRITKVKDSSATITFTLRHKDGSTRVRKTSGYTRLQSNGVDNSMLVRFLSPADIKGTATLLIVHSKADDDMWVYLPALGKVRRLSASNKRDSFFGTDLSYGDVIADRAEDWNHKTLREELLNGAMCYVIESIPGNQVIQKNTGYSKKISWLRKDNFATIRVDYWNLNDQLLKRTLATDIQKVGRGEHWQPMLTEVENFQTGHRTTIKYESFKADLDLSEKLFSPGELDK